MLLSNCFDPDPRVYAEARALVKQGYNVRVLAWDRDSKCPPQETIDGIEIERIYLSSSHGRGVGQGLVMLPLYISMWRRACHYEFDCVHAHDFDTLPIGYALARWKRKPIIYDSHEDYAGMLHGSIPYPLERLIRWMEARIVRHVDLVLTVGEQLRREFERRGSPHSLVVGNWKRLEEFRLNGGTRERVRRELVIPSDAVVIAFIANLGRERHIPELLGAASRRNEVHCIIGGGGPLAQAAAEAASKFKNIHYLGLVNPKDVPAYTWASDVIYYGMDKDNPNAKYSAPNKLFEALAAGRAILTSDFGEIGRIVAEHDCGFLLDDFSEEEVIRGLDACCTPTNLERWKRNAAEAGTRYNWKAAEAELTRAYAERLQLAFDRCGREERVRANALVP